MKEQLTVEFAMPPGSNFEEPNGPDGPLIVHNFPIMVEGAWTSMEGKTVQFGPQDLKANQGNWTDTAIWTRHPLVPGENRSADLCIGAVVAHYYTDKFQAVLEDGSTFVGAAVLGDAMLHRRTEPSRDAAVLIRLPKGQGGFRMTSAEIELLDADFDAQQDVYRPKRYAFGGVTIQRKGGCKACNIPAFAANCAAPGQGATHMADGPAGTPPANQAPPTPGGAEAEPAWAKALSAKLDQLIEMEKAEAAHAGDGKGGAPAGTPPANECHQAAGMAAPQVTAEQFAALNEDVRKLRAAAEKANSQPAALQTKGASFAAGGKLNSEGISSSSMMLVGKNLHLHGRE